MFKYILYIIQKVTLFSMAENEYVLCKDFFFLLFLSPDMANLSLFSCDIRILKIKSSTCIFRIYTIGLS